ncbi:MAG TPA: S24 family peptidase [Bryobacteraceae bacterium]|nr:S24 family peptidase [Bryobacteraceae bacterium]
MSTSLLETRRAQYSVLELCLPGEAPAPAGVIVYDPATGEYRLRFRRDWKALAGEEAEVLELLADDFDARMTELGAGMWLKQCEESLSNTLRISDPELILISDLDRAVERLYGQQIRPRVLPFVTHLPKYSASVAAGKFLDDTEVEEEDWVETPVGMRLQPGMFVVEITGRSMEPRIPDGSLCVFRAQSGGSREGRLLLIERLGFSESGGRYSVKRYFSLKQPHGAEWRHEMIRLEPLNPDFEAWELEKDPGTFRVIGEFIRILREGTI